MVQRLRQAYRVLFSLSSRGPCVGQGPPALNQGVPVGETLGCPPDTLVVLDEAGRDGARAPRPRARAVGVEEGQVGVRLVAVGTVGGLVPVLGPGPATAAVRGLHTGSVAGGGGGCQVGRLGPPTPKHPILASVHVPGRPHVPGW